MPWSAPTDAQLRHARKASDQRYDAERRTTRGPDPRHTTRWQRLRKMQLARHPLCADPYGAHQAQGRTEVATQVDHIREVLSHPALVYDLANLQSLCTTCHARKSQAERQQRR